MSSLLSCEIKIIFLLLMCFILYKCIFFCKFTRSERCTGSVRNIALRVKVLARRVGDLGYAE